MDGRTDVLSLGAGEREREKSRGELSTAEGSEERGVVSPLQSPHVRELGLGQPDTSSGNGSVLLSGLRCVVSRRALLFQHGFVHQFLH